MTSQAVLTEITCAAEVFLATALLHREQPHRTDFLIQEIVNRAAQENITGEHRSGVNVHASQHCVANKAPNPARHRMLFATGKHTRRLLLPGDTVHPDRTGKIFPDTGEIPERYLPLLEWAKERYNGTRAAEVMPPFDPDAWVRQLRESSYQPGERNATDAEQQPRHLENLLSARGIGAEMAKGIDADEYIRQLREGWE